MRRIASAFLALGLCWPLGCARRAGVVWPCLTAPACMEDVAYPQTIQPRVDVAELAGHAAPTATERYRLTAPDCQCRAAAAATTADLIELEYALADALARCDTRKVACAMALTRDLLALRTAEKRNTAAADALEALYRLAEVEGRGQRLAQSLAEAKTATERVNRLHRDGLLSDTDRREVERQQITILDTQLQLELARRQLNGQLQVLLGCTADSTADSTAGYWPEIDWRLEPRQVDEDVEVARALASRHKVRSLRLVLRRLSLETLPVARSVLQVADSSLGTVTKPKRGLPSFHCGGFACDEVDIRIEQFERLLAATEDSVVAEIQSAVLQLQTEQDRAALADETLASWQARLDELVKKREVTDTTWLDVSRVRLQVLAAESTLIERIIAVRRAEVALRRAQGVLVEECGLDATPAR